MSTSADPGVGGDGGTDGEDDDGATDGPGPGSDDGTPAGPPDFDPSFAMQRIDQALAAGAPGLAVAIVVDGYPVFHGGFGVKTPGGAAVGEHTLFNLASVTKLATASTILALAEEGKLSTSDPAVVHTPNLTIAGGSDAVTIHHLLTHGSGIGDPANYGATIAGTLASNTLDRWAPPGAVFNYSNWGYTVAGQVAARASGMAFRDAVRTRVIEPLGMPDATVDATVANGSDYATGQSSSFGPIVPLDLGGEMYEPAGGLWASSADLSAWLVGLTAADETSVLSRAWQPHQRTFEVDTDFYGYGLFIDVAESPQRPRHGGSVSGYTAELTFIPATGFGVAVATNTDDWYAGELARALADHYGGEGQWAPPDLLQVDLAQTPGTYVDPHELGTLQVNGSGGAMQIRVDGSAEIAVQEWGPNFYSFTHPGLGEEIDFNFSPDDTGRPAYFVSRWGVAARSG